MRARTESRLHRRTGALSGRRDHLAENRVLDLAGGKYAGDAGVILAIGDDITTFVDRSADP